MYAKNMPLPVSWRHRGGNSDESYNLQKKMYDSATPNVRIRTILIKFWGDTGHEMR